MPPQTLLRLAALAVTVLAAAAGSPGQCDPVQAGHLLASDPNVDDYFGHASAVDGDTAMVGSLCAQNAKGGVAYAYLRERSDWAQQARLMASEKQPNAYFGMAVAIRGDIAVIGAPGTDTAAGLDTGIVYVFVRDQGIWTQQAKLTASDAKPGDYLGWSVAFDGDTAVVGAPHADAPGKFDAGAAYVFVRDGNTWTQQVKLTASDAVGGNNFGWSIALDSDTTAIGALNADAPGAPNAGAAYVFARNGQTWAQQAKLTAAGGAAADHFGFSLMLSGQTAIVGAPYGDTPAGKEAGSAFVFVERGGVWTQQAALSASDGAPGAYLGWSVFIEGDVAVIGAAYANAAGGFEAGAAYAFTRGNGIWTQRARLEASDGAPFDHFGASAALSTGTAVFGAIYDDPSDKSNAGSAYVFDLHCAPCYADCDGSGELDIDDFICFQTLFATKAPLADCDHDGDLNIDDFICFQTAFGIGCP